MNLMLHHIQRNVIDVLATTDPARYADLKPAGMDGNQFTYHLKQLLADKLVAKNDDGTYSLTQKGSAYLVTRYENPDEMAHTIFLVIIRHGSKMLLRRRLVQPSLGYAGFVHGEPVAGTPLEVSVRERVRLKTGLELDDITVHCSGLIRIADAGTMKSFSHAIIVSADTKSEELGVMRDETGENFWIDTNDLSAVEKLLPSCSEILSAANNGTKWFDLSYKL